MVNTVNSRTAVHKTSVCGGHQGSALTPNPQPLGASLAKEMSFCGGCLSCRDLVSSPMAAGEASLQLARVSALCLVSIRIKSGCFFMGPIRQI